MLKSRFWNQKIKWFRVLFFRFFSRRGAWKPPGRWWEIYAVDKSDQSGGLRFINLLLRNSILNKIIVNSGNSNIIIVLFRIEKKITFLENKITGFNIRFNTINYRIVYFGIVIEYIIKVIKININNIPKFVNYKKKLWIWD